MLVLLNCLVLASFPLVPADAKNEIVIRDQLLGVDFVHDLTVGWIIDPIAPVPHRLQGFRNLDSNVGAFGDAGAHGDVAEVESHVEILNRDVSIATSDGLGQGNCHTG